ncbi:MAG: hypothetical protein AAFU71_05555 [Cyanobacteria bacterium J06632_22]
MTLTPLQRLQVNDGLLITADRWQIAHGYHQQRQKIHYESLHHGGIVSGLGVAVGPVPESAPSKYRQSRWLTIQPGLAIDTWGNPIVVANSESCYLSAQLTETTTIYIVLRHSDRSSADAAAGTDIVQEAFQILEKNSPAEPGEVELCRVRLTPEATEIVSPVDVFNPLENQLDLRFRNPVRARPSRSATVSAWPRRSDVLRQFQGLAETLSGLYPALQAETVPNPEAGDLTHLSHRDFQQLDRSEQQQMAAHLRGGGVLLVEAEWGQLGELYQIEAELQCAIAAGQLGTPSALQQDAERELAEVQQTLQHRVDELSRPLVQWLDQEDLPTAPGLAAEVRSQPFTFAQWPTLHSVPVGLYGWGGLLLLVGPLPRTWCGVNLPRHEQRSAQELGINLLHFAAQRRHMHRLLQVPYPT